MPGTTPLQRTMGALRTLGVKCGKVEFFNPYAGARKLDGKPTGQRQDLFGIVDILCLDPARGFVGVQCCGADYAAHYRKMTGEKAQDCIDWLSTPGGRLEIWSWRKVKLHRGGVAIRWKPRIEAITMADFKGVD